MGAGSLGVLVPEMMNCGSCPLLSSSKQCVLVDVDFLVGAWLGVWVTGHVGGFLLE